MAERSSSQKQEIWRKLLKKRGAVTCWYCNVPVSRSLPDHHPQRATLDHIRPLSQGGTWRIDNIRIACFPCNSRRGAMPTSTYLESLKG